MTIECMKEENQTKLYAISMKVRWGDMDALGHVNNTCYFRYCEQVRMEWFASLDLTADSKPDSIIVIINAYCEFLSPVRYPCNLVLEMSGGKPGNSSFMSYYTIKNADKTDELFAKGQAKVVFVDSSGTSSVEMPASVRSTLQQVAS